MAKKTKTPFMQAEGSFGQNYLIDQMICSGSVFFVDASGVNEGTAAGYGLTPDQPFSTIDAAINACTADAGDLIVVLPGHTENITGAAGIALDVAGVKILGMGEGRRRPRITFTTAVAASCDISAARCVIENLVFICGIDAQTAMFNVSAADFVMKNCEILTATSSVQATLGILTTASADRMLIEDCQFHGTVDAGTTSQISIVGGDFIVIRNCTFIGACATTGNIASATTDSTDLVIADCVFLNRTADDNNQNVSVTASTTGLLVNNRFCVIDSTAVDPFTVAGMNRGGNYYVGGVDGLPSLG